MIVYVVGESVVKLTIVEQVISGLQFEEPKYADLFKSFPTKENIPFYLSEREASLHYYHQSTSVLPFFTVQINSDPAAQDGNTFKKSSCALILAAELPRFLPGDKPNLPVVFDGAIIPLANSTENPKKKSYAKKLATLNKKISSFDLALAIIKILDKYTNRKLGFFRTHTENAVALQVLITRQMHGANDGHKNEKEKNEAFNAIIIFIYNQFKKELQSLKEANTGGYAGVLSAVIDYLNVVKHDLVAGLTPKAAEQKEDHPNPNPIRQPS